MKKRYFNFSLSFYNREDSLKDLQIDCEPGISLTHLNQQISTSTQTLFKKFNDGDIVSQRELMKKNPLEYLQIFFEILTEAYEDMKLMKYVLPTIDGMIMDDRRILQSFLLSLEDQEENKNWLTVLNLVIHNEFNDITVYESALRVKSQIIGELGKKKLLNQQNEYLLMLIHLRSSNHRYSEIEDYCLLTCYAFLLKQEHLSNKFIDNKGQEQIYQILKHNKNNLQVMYYALLVLWLLSFCESSYSYFSQPNIIETIQKVSREKHIRVAFQIFKNLAQKSQSCIETMVDCGLLKECETLLKGNIKDKETIEDIQFIAEILEKNIKILSSYEKYVKEINLQILEWNSVHTEKFWKENIKKFEENEYQTIKKLANLLNSDIPKNVAIACYDIGEFCRFHPFGRNVIEGLDKKKVIMQKARDNDPSVRENALLALQKIMLHNWMSISK